MTHLTLLSLAKEKIEIKTRCQDMSAIDMLKVPQLGTEPVRVRMRIVVYYIGVHIGATRRVRSNLPCAAAMRPFVELL